MTHLLSILDPGTPDPQHFEGAPPQGRLTLRFHDVIAPGRELVLPEPAHVEALLEFGRTLPDNDPAHLLVHCHMGVSRSTAAMAALMVQANPEAGEDAIFSHLTNIRPQAWPNSLMIGFADEQLGRRGRMVEELRRLYARKLVENPQIAEGLKSIGRGAEVAMAQG